MNKKTLIITQTAVTLAALIAAQAFTGSLGQLVTGSLVNFILIMATIVIDYRSGIFIAAISPFFAYFLGIGTTILILVPCIAAGNVVLVLIYALFMGKLKLPSAAKWLITVILAAAVKCAFLYLVIVKWAVFLIPNVSDKQISVLSASFGAAQLFTALIGGFVAFLTVPVMKKVIR